MVVEENALQLGNVVRAVRVVAGHLKLEHAAAGDLYLGEGEPQALHILGEVSGGDAVVHGGGENEAVVLHEGSAVLIVAVKHNRSSLNMC